MALSESDFNRQCVQFLLRSREYADGDWSLSVRQANGQILELRTDNLAEELPDGASLMLMKNEKRRLSNDKIHSYEYSVVYSPSYEVPVMYFCVSDQTGAQVPLDEVLASLSCDDLSTIVNQVEHPLLFRPFYMVHPCRTRDFMEPHLKLRRDCYVISWLSIVGTLLGLQLDDQFGRLDMARAP